jgi:2-polyprenyl-3-methyl-5-hydroxy-6-metoxy-1,4-benzoquinol methylase
VVEGVFGLGYPLDYLAIVVVCMSYATIDELRSQLGGAPKHSPEYLARMMHPIPQTTTVDRVEFILDRVKGKRVLEFGASGSLQEKVKAAAAEYLGVDREAGDQIVAFDLDEIEVWNGELPSLPSANADVIVCGEVLEHLGNPQFFLKRLKKQYAGVPVVISVPNAHTVIGRRHLASLLENVNRDHTAWYSYTVLKTLLARVGYEIRAFYWYNGDGPTAEGLIVVVE